MRFEPPGHPPSDSYPRQAASPRGPRAWGPRSRLEELCRLRELAKGEKQYAAAIQAEIKRGEAAGFYVKRRENIKLPMSPEQLEARVCALLRIAPEQLRAMHASTALRTLADVNRNPNKPII